MERYYFLKKISKDYEDLNKIWIFQQRHAWTLGDQLDAEPIWKMK